jgi:hypothetical protein
MEENELVIRQGMTSYEEMMVKRFPYNILIRCLSLMRRAETNFLDFYDEYDYYITGTGETTEEMTYFDEIPITEDGKYYLNLKVEDTCQVTYFEIICK